MSSGLRKLGTITTLFRRVESQHKNHGSNKLYPRRIDTKPTRFVQEKRGNPTDCPQVISYVTKRLPAVTSAVAASATAVITARHRLGFINGQGAAVELRAVQGLYGSLRLAP